MRSRLRLRTGAAGIALLAACSLSLEARPQATAAQTAQDQERAARGRALLDRNAGGPDLIKGANGEPILRYPVAHQHAATGCLGWLYISRTTMRFEVLGPPQDLGHAFELQLSDLTEAKQWRFWGRLFPEAEFKFRGGGTYHFFHVRKGILSDMNTKFTFGDVLPFQDLIDGARRFDDVAAVLKAREAPPPAPPAPPPTISMLEPAGAEEGRTVPAYDPTLRVRGIASQASGIVSVSVNGQSAFFKPLAPQTVEFDLRDLPLGTGMSAVVIVATGTDKSVGQMTFKVTRPEARVLEPGPGAEVEASAVRVRGLATGFRDVDRVEVAGQVATLHRRADGSVEFEAASVPLTVGSNNLPGSVVASTGQRLSFSLNVTRKPPPGPPALTLDEVENALANLPKKRVTEMVEQYGVDFEVTDDVDQRLRASGADSGLLLDLVKAYKAPARRKTVASPPAQSTPLPVSSPAAPQPVTQTSAAPATGPANPVSSPPTSSATVASPPAAAPAKAASPPGPQAPAPTVRWMNPAGGVLETTTSAILAQGVAVGFNGVEKVELAGTSLSLGKLADGSVEFHTVLQLQLGQNKFQGVAIGSNGVRVAFQLEIKRVAAK